ncbi:hypothetical protein [Pseudomonas citronellolis]|uniref:hypothetical protein n=1 Tax=Pseudomonas citronellolis TaxID=53408 RepID=UPI0023E4123E|nr:hypothetical protein [Pseudomonas citronellolis]
MGTSLSAETGQDLFVEGAYIKGERIRIAEPVDLMVPGSMLIPFPVHIGAGDLTLSRITPDWKYYCGAAENVAASFPGLGSVIANGDCVGVRIANDASGEKEWVVDNSIHNRMNTIWNKSMSSAQAASLNAEETRAPFDVRSLKRITFDGFYGGQLHFTWQEIDGEFRDAKDFTFDFTGQPTTVGIKGNVFTVKKAGNLSLEYEWVKIAAN